MDRIDRADEEVGGDISDGVDVNAPRGVAPEEGGGGGGTGLRVLWLYTGAGAGPGTRQGEGTGGGGVAWGSAER